MQSHQQRERRGGGRVEEGGEGVEQFAGVGGRCLNFRDIEGGFSFRDSRGEFRVDKVVGRGLQVYGICAISSQPPEALIDEFAELQTTKEQGVSTGQA